MRRREPPRRKVVPPGGAKPNIEELFSAFNTAKQAWGDLRHTYGGALNNVESRGYIKSPEEALAINRLRLAAKNIITQVDVIIAGIEKQNAGEQDSHKLQELNYAKRTATNLENYYEGKFRFQDTLGQEKDIMQQLKLFEISCEGFSKPPKAQAYALADLLNRRPVHIVTNGEKELVSSAIKTINGIIKKGRGAIRLIEEHELQKSYGGTTGAILAKIQSMEAVKSFYEKLLQDYGK